MTPLDEALVLRGVDFYRLAEHLKPPEGNVTVLSGSVTLDRLLDIKRGDEPTEAEAKAIGTALDFPPGFFDRWREKPPLESSALFICKIGTRDRVVRCACSKPATLLCDEPCHGIATCDRKLCRDCAVEVAPDEHRCQEHAGPPVTPLALRSVMG